MDILNERRTKMGREIKRISMDFDWPLNKIWDGYVNPHYKTKKCQKCDGSGYSEIARLLKDKWYGHTHFKPEGRDSESFLPNNRIIQMLATRNTERNPEFYGSGKFAIDQEATRLCRLFNTQWMHHLNNLDIEALVKAERLHDFTHNWTNDGWQQKDPPYIPSAKEVNEWSISGFGHDSINCYIIIEEECKRLRINSVCEDCQGEGDIWPDQESRYFYETWQKTEPPEGDGYQLWETVSEGSPISLVFKTPEELATYLISDEYSWNENDKGTTYEQWLTFIKGPGWAPSLIVSDGNVKTGIQATSNN